MKQVWSAFGFAIILGFAGGPGCETDSRPGGQDCEPNDISHCDRCPTGKFVYCNEDSECGCASCLSAEDCSCEVGVPSCFPPSCGCLAACTIDSDCDDENECTSDTCDSEAKACVNSAVADGTTCMVGTQAGTCMAGVCVEQTPCLNPVVLSVDFIADDPSFVTDTVETGGAAEMTTREDTGGDPGGYRRMTHTLPSESSITVFHLFEQEYDPADGAIDHINYSESRIQFDPPFSGAGIGAGFFLVQTGNRSTMPLPTDGAFTSTDWESVVLESIQPDDFSRVPDFTTGGAPIQFGFYRSNSHGPGEEIMTTHGIDNWQVQICRSAELCTGGEDEDGDELIDCDDVFDCACTDACIEGFLEACSPTNLLANPGFEEGPSGIGWDQAPGFPTAPGIWGGDLADVVGEVSGITPLEGDDMMQFQSTFDQPVPTESSSSERVQLIDASGLLGSRICGVASFARVSGDGQTDNRFAVVTAWYDGSPSEFDGFATHITTECFEEDRCGNSQVDIDPNSWVRAASTTDLPAQGTVTAVVMLRAQENVYNDTIDDLGPELDGHFVDDVGLFVVPTEACP